MTLEKKFAGSKYIEDDFLSNSTEHNFNLGKYPSPVYKSVYYDENYEVYYRFVNHGFIQKARDIRSNALYPQNTSVIILNKDFEIIGETKLPPDKYVINMTFQAKEGIYISTSNPFSPTFNENIMEFKLITINKLK